MEEPADHVGGGSDAENNGAKDFLPPGQQQHWVLPPPVVRSRLVSLYQTNGTFSFLPVILAVGKVVTVVCDEKMGDGSQSCINSFRFCLVKP